GCGAVQALRLDRREKQDRADPAVVGFPRLRVRQPPCAIREILRRCVLPGEDQRLPQLRLEAGRGFGRCSPCSAAPWGRGLRRFRWFRAPGNSRQDTQKSLKSKAVIQWRGALGHLGAAVKRDPFLTIRYSHICYT